MSNIDNSKTRSQMWTAVVMLMITVIGIVGCETIDGWWIGVVALSANAATWWMVISACRDDLREPTLSPLNLALKGDRVVRDEKPLRRRA